jgi:diguanylate cyclase (GGDEF)-like protein
MGPCGAEQGSAGILGSDSVSLANRKAINLLAALPSVLGMRDLRRRLRRSLSTPGISDALAIELLRLDPLAVLRGLRAVAAPVYGPPPEPWTIGAMAKRLGSALTRRLLDTPSVAIAGTKPVRQLWLHAVAAATACTELARAAQIDPEHAYLAGLLHDLPAWLDCLSRRQCGEGAEGTAADWLRHWNLPPQLVGARAARQPVPRAPVPGDVASVIAIAEYLAELAGFEHPGTSRDATGTRLVCAEKSDLVRAQQLRVEVEQRLHAARLEAVHPDLDLELDHMGLDEDLSLLVGRQHGDLGDVVLSVLSCARSASYRGIVTAILAAAVRYGGYDRAFFVKWNHATGYLMVRAKADSSPRRIRLPRVVPNASEAATLRRSLQEERPLRLDAEFGQREGLLAALCIDEALLVPMNTEFETPAFLVLDRSLSARPIQMVLDAHMATALGLTGSLLADNLRLKRERQRAHKFALTDQLTRLFNRRMGLATLEHEVARAHRSERPLTVLMCDLDHFKQLNDTFGHLQGDAALRAAAEVMRRTVRRSDTICRYGGEEFLVVLPDTNTADATVLAARLFTAVETRGAEIGMPLTMSIGLTLLRQGDTVEDVLQRADHALYASKDQGRNRFSADIEGDDEPVVVSGKSLPRS